MAKWDLPAGDEELLAQCEVETFHASGKGGQHVNKTESAVRLRHRPTGLVASCQESRSQWQNRRRCLQKLRAQAAARSFVPKPRVPTSKTGAARRKSRAAKIRHSQKKIRRTARDWRDEEA